MSKWKRAVDDLDGIDLVSFQSNTRIRNLLDLASQKQALCEEVALVTLCTFSKTADSFLSQSKDICQTFAFG